MPQQHFTKPLYIFFLVLPSGICTGFGTVTIPYLLTHNGFSVAQTAGIVALGASASLWRFLWGPVADLTLSLKKWFWIGVLASAASLLLLCVTPLSMKGALLFTVIYFISQLAANLELLPISGIMANRIETKKKGRAGGWYQAGNLGGVGIGGGAGLWLATHYNLMTAGVVLCVVMLLSALVVIWIKDVKHENNTRIKTSLLNMGKDILAMIRIPIVLFVIIMLCMPIGTGAATNLWSAIADDWKTSVDTVALITGILSGLVSVLGCLTGGLIADRWGNWVAYLGAGLFCAIITMAMAAFPMLPYVYITGVLIYAFGLGLVNAAFTSVILYAIGKRNASTKYALLSSLGNLPVVYMTTFDGWAHDKHSSKYMLVAEALVGLVFILICIIVLNRMNSKKLVLKTID